MKRNPFLASILSLFVPGLGQMYAGKGKRGAVILIAVIIVGNLNAIWLSAYALSSTVPETFWGCTLPRLLHDIFAFYSVVFLIWQVIDVYQLTKKS